MIVGLNPTPTNFQISSLKSTELNKNLMLINSLQTIRFKSTTILERLFSNLNLKQEQIHFNLWRHN